MSKHKKSKKKNFRRPPLSALNKVTYYFILGLTLLFPFGLLMLFALLRTFIGSKMGAVATEETSASLWLLAPCFITFLVVFIWIISCYEEKKTIFGKHEKAERKPIIVKNRKFIKAVTAAAITVYLIMWVPAIGSIWSRTDVTPSHVNCYTLFGRSIKSYPIEDAQAVEVSVFYEVVYRGSCGWRISYTVKFEDGRSYTFENNPSIIVEIDSLFHDVKKTVYGADKLENLCEEYHLNEVERVAVAQVCMISSE